MARFSLSLALSLQQSILPCCSFCSSSIPFEHRASQSLQQAPLLKSSAPEPKSSFSMPSHFPSVFCSLHKANVLRRLLVGNGLCDSLKEFNGQAQRPTFAKTTEPQGSMFESVNAVPMFVAVPVTAIITWRPATQYSSHISRPRSAAPVHGPRYCQAPGTICQHCCLRHHRRNTFG